MFLAEHAVRTRWEHIAAPREFERFTALLQSHCLSPSAKVLDIGTGKGQLPAMLNARGYGAYGIDLRHGVTGKFGYADARILPFADASFDVVTSVMLFDDLYDFQKPSESDVAAIVREAHRVPRSGGCFALEDLSQSKIDFSVFSACTYRDSTYGFYLK